MLRYIGMLALCSSIEGPSPQAINNQYGPHLSWVFQNAAGPTIIKAKVANFFCLIA